MSEHSDRTFKAFLRLKEGEKTELIDLINDYLKGGYAEQRSINERFTKVQTGPLQGGCPYCGR